MDLFTASAIAIGALAAVVTGLSKTALPGAGLLAVPLFAVVAEGRGIPGITLPVLLFADVFAVSWYRHHTRWDLLRPLAAWVVAGFAIGTTFFVVVGSNVRALEVVIALGIVTVVALQIARIVRDTPPRHATPTETAMYGTAGGFTTFVSNSAGPIMNTYLVGLGLDRTALVGTSAWFYFAVNLAKIPVYLAIGAWSTGGRFFTVESLKYDLLLFPFVVIGVYGGRALLPRLHDRFFLWLVLALSLAGAVKLLLA
ncbi:MAG: sulfite exporter TauE/SafE family protein [Actinobacteria bacterium]|nr:sulfite exporter TauE/SafE family protein [Actinomycetota bacterium]